MSGFLGSASPRWFTIPAHRPFLEDLARSLWRELSPLGPEALAEAVVLLPTRRAARTLAEAFLKSADRRAVLLPQIRALGDLDEGEPPFEAGDIALDLPPAISPARRRFELAGLVVEHQDLLERRPWTRAPPSTSPTPFAAFLDALADRGVPGSRRCGGVLVEGELGPATGWSQRLSWRSPPPPGRGASKLWGIWMWPSGAWR